MSFLIIDLKFLIIMNNYASYYIKVFLKLYMLSKSLIYYISQSSIFQFFFSYLIFVELIYNLSISKPTTEHLKKVFHKNEKSSYLFNGYKL